MNDLDTLFETLDNDTITAEDKLHWYNKQKRCLKKREFWRAVIYALTRPEEYKPILLKKAIEQKEICDTLLEKLEEYGVEVGYVRKSKKQ